MYDDMNGAMSPTILLGEYSRSSSSVDRLFQFNAEHPFVGLAVYAIGECAKEQLYRKCPEIGTGRGVAFSHRPGKVVQERLQIDTESHEAQVRMES